MLCARRRTGTTRIPRAARARSANTQRQPLGLSYTDSPAGMSSWPLSDMRKPRTILSEVRDLNVKRLISPMQNEPPGCNPTKIPPRMSIAGYLCAIKQDLGGARHRFCCVTPSSSLVHASSDSCKPKTMYLCPHLYHSALLQLRFVPTSVGAQGLRQMLSSRTTTGADELDSLIVRRVCYRRSIFHHSLR
ncbi:hypothetical protein PsYK624_011170 [Phanerochaete sordida]|uniref:Uncharacterized protein n=1 Tax=Phanerochaete sordida TaxID=48140 RepID=A0A9P3FZ79_9APHY|nr:hypothetical protein PsYK624_011170 [Phanerochaete sordida]